MNLACGDDLSTAIERPRWHNQIVPGITTLEVGPEGEDKELIAELVKLGHEIGLFDINVGAAEGAPSLPWPVEWSADANSAGDRR